VRDAPLLVLVVPAALALSANLLVYEGCNAFTDFQM
jgi:hypothetical protein